MEKLNISCCACRIFKSSASRTIAAGLGGAAVGYMGAKVAHRLASGTSSMYLPAYHRTYYYGNRNYVNAVSVSSNCNFIAIVNSCFTV